MTSSHRSDLPRSEDTRNPMVVPTIIPFETWNSKRVDSWAEGSEVSDGRNVIFQ